MHKITIIGHLGRDPEMYAGGRGAGRYERFTVLRDESNSAPRSAEIRKGKRLWGCQVSESWG